jgi:hypothetical protein
MAFLRETTVTGTLNVSTSVNATSFVTATGQNPVNTARIFANSDSELIANGINLINTATIQVSVVSGVGGNANVGFSVIGGGTQGTQGVQGTTGTGTQGPAGTSQGVQGVQGTQGVQSVQGIQGTSGVGGGASVAVSVSAPGSPSANDLWWASEEGMLKIYYDDGNTTQWVDAVASPLSEVAAGSTFKTISIPDPVATDNIALFRTQTSMTISKIISVLRGSSTPSVTFSVKYGADRSTAGTEVVTSGITCTNVTTGLHTTSFNNPTIPANNYVWMLVTAQSGTVNELNMQLVF